MRHASICAAIALAALGVAGFGRADAADARAGRELAQSKCAPCHSIDGGGGAEAKRAPSLEEIARGPKGGGDPLRDFLRSTHTSVAHPGAMPNLSLSEEQMADLSAYLSALRKE